MSKNPVSKSKPVKRNEPMRRALTFFLALPVSNANALWMKERDLDIAALLMYDQPDSALAVVEKIEPRFAISESTSVEQEDSISHTVFNYYRKHGSRREKLDMCTISWAATIRSEGTKRPLCSAM